MSCLFIYAKVCVIGNVEGWKKGVSVEMWGSLTGHLPNLNSAVLGCVCVNPHVVYRDAQVEDKIAILCTRYLHNDITMLKLRSLNLLLIQLMLSQILLYLGVYMRSSHVFYDSEPTCSNVVYWLFCYLHNGITKLKQLNLLLIQPIVPNIPLYLCIYWYV